jgi:chorismate synthase
MGIANRDWDNWLEIMAVTGEKPASVRETQVRPGHADLAGALKMGTDDMRDVLERASARETAARVAAGGVAKAVLAVFGVEVRSYVNAIGDIEWAGDVSPESVDFDAVEVSDVRCPDGEVAARMRGAIDQARADGESLGGIFTVVATGLVAGVGSYAEAGLRLDGRLAGAVVSIPAIKGVEFGDGFAAARRVGSSVHDEIHYDEERGFWRPTNHAGGLEGGMTNGAPLVFRAAMKPIPTLMKPLASVDLVTHEPVDASKERSDVCAVPAAGVVAEAEVAMVLADAYLEQFGSGFIGDVVETIARFRERSGA